MNREQQRVMRMIRKAGSPEAAGEGLVQRLLDLEAQVQALQEAHAAAVNETDETGKSDPEEPTDGA